MQKIALMPFLPAGIALVISGFGLTSPQYFGLQQQSVGFTIFVTTLLGLTAAAIFFIQQNIINHDTIQKKRQGHFERLKNEVLQKCVDKPAYLAIDKKGFSRSLIELYVNIFDVLKAYNRFPRVRLHFEHEDYKETKVLLDEIENRSIEHNKKISEFM
jgi:hypothetical protein